MRRILNALAMLAAGLVAFAAGATLAGQLTAMAVVFGLCQLDDIADAVTRLANGSGPKG